MNATIARAKEFHIDYDALEQNTWSNITMYQIFHGWLQYISPLNSI